MADGIESGGRSGGDMDPEAYRAAAHRVADWTADYLRDVEQLSGAEPG